MIIKTFNTRKEAYEFSLTGLEKFGYTFDIFKHMNNGLWVFEVQVPETNNS